MGIVIQTAIPERDYELLAHVLNTVWTDAPVTAEMMLEWDMRRPKEQLLRRSVAMTQSDEILGYAEVMYLPWKPVGHFWLWLMVHPAKRNQGIGKALYDEALQFAQTNGAIHLSSQVSESQPEGLRFAQQRNFTIERREFESILPLRSFDERAFEGVIEAVEATGIRFLSLADLGDTPENRQKLYAINRATSLDIPGSDGSFPSFEQSSNWLFPAPWFRAEGQLLALDDDNFVGYCSIGYFKETNSMYNFMTGVDRAYRGHKIALALKLLAIRFAKAYGAAYIRTNNDSQNEPMLAINHKLGYQPQSGVLQLVANIIASASVRLKS
jgi:GNAT superfamily N-acetyltransferase